MNFKVHFIFFIFIVHSCNAQYNKIIKINEVYNPLDVYENDVLIENYKEKKVLSYIYNINEKGNSVEYFDTSDKTAEEATPIIYFFKENQNNGEQVLLIKDNEIYDSLKIKFSDKFNSVLINGRDAYYLNSKYYIELKQKVKFNNSILDLVDLLDDNLGDYPYQFAYLNKISTNNKYFNKNFKIKKAKIITNRTQSNQQDIWNVTYCYDKDNVLKSVSKKSLDNEVSFEKKLLLKKGTEYIYKIYINVESRYEDNDELTFDIKNNDFKLLHSRFHFGSLREENLVLERILFQKTVKE